MIINPVVSGIQLPDLTTPAGVGQILSGYQAINEDGEIITGSIPSQGAQTITPGTSARTIASGRYLSGTQTIAGDSDLVAGNIKSGVNIFGVTGNYSGVEPIYGTIDPDDIITDADSRDVTVVLPQNISQLYGLSVAVKGGASGEDYYVYCYPCADISVSSTTVSPAQNQILRILMYYTGDRIDFSARTMSISGNQIIINAGSYNLLSGIGGAYYYIPA